MLARLGRYIDKTQVHYEKQLNILTGINVAIRTNLKRFFTTIGVVCFFKN